MSLGIWTLAECQDTEPCQDALIYVQQKSKWGRSRTEQKHESSFVNYILYGCRTFGQAVVETHKTAMVMVIVIF